MKFKHLFLSDNLDLTFSISFSGGKGVEEAAENRNYLSSRMSEEVGEMVRVLQLTTYDEDEWDSDNLVFLRSFYSSYFNLAQYETHSLSN